METIGEGMTTRATSSRRSSASRPGRPLLAGLVLLCLSAFVCVSPLFGAQGSATTSVTLVVGEAADLNVASSLVRVRIRLARGVVAQLWFDSTCSAPTPGAITIHTSGTQQFDLRTVTSGGPGVSGNVCLASSDGQIRTSAPVTLTPTISQ